MVAERARVAERQDREIAAGERDDEARKAFSDATGAPADVFAQSAPLGRLGSPDDVSRVT
jgi:hypothetical protein